MTEINEPTIQKARQGDARAFAQIYQAFAALVFGIALRISNAREAAEEITQDVFVTIYRKLTQFNFLSSLKTWIYRIAVNTAINSRRSQMRETAKRLVFEKMAVLAEGAPGPEAQVLAAEEAQSMLDQLPPEQRVCIVLRNIEGLSYEEIAETLQVNLNTVRSRLKRARERLLTWKLGEQPGTHPGDFPTGGER